jgi:hypothetical protein
MSSVGHLFVTATVGGLELERAVRDRNGAFNEPWLFVIGPNRRIVARWDNLFTADEVTASLEDLIRIP